MLFVYEVSHFHIARGGQVVHHIDVVLNTVCISFAKDRLFTEFPFHPERGEESDSDSGVTVS